MITKPKVHQNFELTVDYVRRMAQALNRLSDDDYISGSMAATPLESLILTSPNGSKWRVTVSDMGVLNVASV